MAIGSGLLDLDLDLDVFSGPFDLLLTVVLREELDLLEVELGEVVSAYVETLAERGDLDLEATTEFLLLIASLLELKSRLMLPGDPELEAMEPEEAIEELVARMLDYRRFREAAAELVAILEAESPYLYRNAPLPPELRRVAVESAVKVYEPEHLAAALGDLLTPPEEIELPRIPTTISLRHRLSVLRSALSGASSFDFDERFGSEGRQVQAVTLLALLELHGRGEADWRQEEVCGPITVLRRAQEVETVG